MRVAIIGGGFTGLVAARRLSDHGHLVTVFEKQKSLGGLAKGFREANWDWHLEDLFHHFFTTDEAAIKLIQELGLSKELFFKKCQTGIFRKGQILPLDTPWSVLAFPQLGVLDNLRVAMATAYLKYFAPGESFEKITASDCLKKLYGEKAYDVLWEPLLAGKFAKKKDLIAMVWFWARIKKRSFRLGYFKKGLPVLVAKLEKEILKNKGEIVHKEIKKEAELAGFDRILVTTPTSIFEKIFGEKLAEDYKKRLKKMEMIGAMTLILRLKKPFLADRKTYWLNINEPGFPFVALVEQTNFISEKHYGGETIVYVGGYYPQTHSLFKKSAKEVLEIFKPFLKIISPNFNFERDLKGVVCRQYKHAQPIVFPGYKEDIPTHKTPLANVYLANMQQIYPWDRGVNYAIEMGEKAAEDLENEGK